MEKRRKQKRSLNNKGFSLMELVFVLAVLGVLTTIIFPYYRAATKKAIRVQAEYALAEVFRLENIYYYDHFKFSPSIKDIGLDILPVLKYYTLKISTSGDLQKFSAVVSANLDKDDELDVLSINEQNKLILESAD